ncbi:hypothetical protein BGW42_007352, partial [Actinomortierella wolfii]
LSSLAEKLVPSDSCLEDLDVDPIDRHFAENATDSASSDEDDESGSMVDRAERDRAATSVEDMVANMNNSSQEHDVHSTLLKVAERRREIATSLEQHVLHVIRDSLIHDEYILQTATAFNIPEDKRIVQSTSRSGAKCLVFFVQKDFFDDWLKRHSTYIGAAFTQRTKPHSYSVNIKDDSTQSKKDRAGQIVYRYSCHRKSRPYRDKNQVKGGKSGKPRNRRASIRSDCKASINAIFRPKETSDGLPGGCYRVEYLFEHNHKLGCLENLGAMRKSDAIKRRIKAMLMRGMSIQAIMNHLTIDHARFTRLLEGNDTTPVSRDDFITYDDVYNILYAIVAKEVRKSPDDVESAKLWMEELEKNNYFTFYDKAHGLYHGFSSPWQLDQLRRWGDVFCFDGTHHARG